MALQKLGEVDMERLIAEMRNWGEGTLLEQRAAAALCEPGLLRQAKHAGAVPRIVDRISPQRHRDAEERKTLQVRRSP
jgi:hypothetical protein